MRLPINVAIVGSGPAGFYTAQRLIKNPRVNVDIYEKLPVPFGLVRYGVAPDHVDIKNVIHSFSKIAANERVNFFGNISLGKDINVDDLISCYDAVVLAYGASRDKYLGIEGEVGTKNTISARNFVGWYNGVPEDKNLDINLDCDTACIIGQGNVALDCARILLKPESFHKTDITSHSHAMLLKRKLKRLYIIGRRGPLQASFTTKELRQLINANPTSILIDPRHVFSDFGIKDVSNLSSLDARKQRKAKLFLDASLRATSELTTKHGIECVFKFFAKPIKIVAKSETEPTVDKLVFCQTAYNNLDDFLDEAAIPFETDITQSIECGLIIRSIGYKAVLVDPKLPYNHKLGAIVNTNGRIHGFQNLYCSGWLATGASGVIAGTLGSSQLTAQSILDDIETNRIAKNPSSGSKPLLEYFDKNKIEVVHFNDWLKIDALEQKIGEISGKSREKIVDVESMLEFVNENKGKQLE